MDFDDFSTIKSIFDGKIISQWEHHIAAITFDEGMRCHSTRIELFYFNDNVFLIALWVSAFSGSGGSNIWRELRSLWGSLMGMGGPDVACRF